MPIHNLNHLISNLRRPGADGHTQLHRMVVARAKAMRTEFLREVWRQLYCWYQKRVALAELQALDDAALKDIGLYRSGIEAALDRSVAVSNPPKQRVFTETPPLGLQRTSAAV